MSAPEGQRLQSRSVFSTLTSLTRALCPVHIPDNVRAAARIISGLPVSIRVSNRGTPLFWKILSAPASSLANTMRLLAA